MRELSRLAAAVAVGIGAASLSVGAQAQEDPSLEFYGELEYRLVNRESVDLDGFMDKARIGMVGARDADFLPGVRVRGQIEFNLPVNDFFDKSTDGGGDSDGSRDVEVRKAQINLQGNYGELIVGRQNNLLVDTKKIDTFKNDSGVFLRAPDRIGAAITYVTPKFGDVVELYGQMANDGPSGASDTSETDVDGTVFGANATVGGLDLRVSRMDTSSKSTAKSGNRLSLTSVGGSYSFGPISVFGTYQHDGFDDAQIYGIGGAYSAIEHLTLKTGLTGIFDADQVNGVNQGTTAAFFLADYEIAENLSAFVQYVWYDDDAGGGNTNGNDSAISTGVAYSWNYDFLK